MRMMSFLQVISLMMFSSMLVQVDSFDNHDTIVIVMNNFDIHDTIFIIMTQFWYYGHNFDSHATI